jgi:Zn finger protein HypA/HybF involved in hydrogenase expression
MKHDCANCNHHWQADGFEDSCPNCHSWHVMTTDEWSVEDATNEENQTNAYD